MSGIIDTLIDIYKHMKKILFILALLIVNLLFISGCAAYVTPVGVGVVAPEPVVYYGWYDGYYGPYYWGPSGGVVVFGAPHGWHGHYYHGGSYRGWHGHR